MFESRYLLQSSKTPSIRGFFLYYKGFLLQKTESVFRFRNNFSLNLDTKLTRIDTKKLPQEFLPVSVYLILMVDPFPFKCMLIHIFHG